MKRELVSARGVSHLGAEFGAAIRKLVTRTHRMAPSLAGHEVATIEKRPQDEESDIVAQRRIVDDRVSSWRQVE